MAKIGLKYFKFSVLTENQDGTHSYAGAQSPGKAISCSVQVNNNTAKLRADDEDAEVDSSFSGGTVSLGVDRDDLSTQSTLLGHTLSDGVMTRNANDTAPYVGVGRIISLLRDGAKKYKTEILYKVKFGEPNQEDNTKQETVSFGTSTLEGQIGTLANGDWSDTKIHDTLSAAQTYIDTAFAAPTTNSGSGSGTP